MFESEEVSDILSRAVRAVEDAKVPTEYKAVAFERAVDLLSSRRKTTAAVPVERALVPFGQGTERPTVLPASAALDGLAARVRLTRDVLERVYTEADDGLSVTVFPDRLAKSRSAGARELALLVAAAGQVASDRPTPSDDIRRVAEEYDKFDGPNFAATLATMKGNFQILGSARARTFKLTKPGWVAAGALIVRLAGADKAAA